MGIGQDESYKIMIVWRRYEYIMHSPVVMPELRDCGYEVYPLASLSKEHLTLVGEHTQILQVKHWLQR